jgi:hypothetical protein
MLRVLQRERDNILSPMVLTKEELISTLQNEVRILVHLAGKVDRSKLDYRPTAKQRSTLELLQYMVIMGPNVIRAIQAGAFDGAAWGKADAAAKAMSFDETIAAIAHQHTLYPELLNGFSESDFRGSIEMFGRSHTRGSHIVNLVVSGYAAYRTQLFLYLKACGRDELNTMNLWGGEDGAMN